MFVQNTQPHMNTPIQKPTHSMDKRLEQQLKENELLAQELWDISHKRKELAAQEAKIKKALIDMAHNETLVMEKFLFVKEQRKGSVQYNDIPELLSIDLEQYRKPSIDVWKLSKR